MPTKEEAKEELKKLIDIYNKYKDDNDFANNEAQVCDSLIKPFFNKVLGWNTDYPNVIREAKKSGKRIDYLVKLYDITQFVIEAKSLSHDIVDNSSYYKQAIGYGHSKEKSYAILTNFHHFIILNCNLNVKNPLQAQVNTALDLTNLSNEHFDLLWNFSYEIWKEKGEDNPELKIKIDVKRRRAIDELLLEDLKKWRISLLNNLKKNLKINNYDWKDEKERNYIEEEIQKFIDRLIFICYCEDKELSERELGSLIGEKEDKYFLKKSYLLEKIRYIFKIYRDIYNSDLFNEGYCDQFYFEDIVLFEILKDLRNPKEGIPYDFGSIEADILGKTYEKFIGHIISGEKTFTEEENKGKRKKGGIYYTPQYIVNYIVNNTVREYIKDLSFEEIKKVKILDPACGSGSFLIKVFDILVEESQKKLKKELSYNERKELLLSCIFGVDRDERACDIAKLNLSLKLAERGKKLPELHNNIKVGDSLIDNEKVEKYKAFKWNKEFKDIMNNGGFDIIIGNPPYIKEYTYRKVFEEVKETDLKKYYQGKMDIWYIFTCHSLDLLKEGGLHSFIAQNNWITSAGASILRNKVLTDSQIISFLDFGDYKVFKDAGIQTMIFVLKKTKPQNKYLVDYMKILGKDIPNLELINYIMTKKGNKRITHFESEVKPNKFLDKEIAFINSQFIYLLNKIESKENYKLIDKEVAQGIVCPQEYVINNHLDILKNPSIKEGDSIFVLSTEEYKNFKLTNKEKEIIKPFYTTDELHRYYGSDKNYYWLIYSNMEVRKNINDYPNIKTHLGKFKKIMTSDFRPYGLHRAREQHFFEGGKILSLRKTEKPYFTYVDFPCYVSQTYFILKPKNINLKYLTGLLNSNLIFFWLKLKGKRQGKLLQVDKGPILQIPICKAKKIDEEVIIKNVDLIFDLKKELNKTKLPNEKNVIESKITYLENKINERIYLIYNLIKVERDVIEDYLES